MLKALLLFTLMTLSPKIRAYPHFVGFGYTSCITCHYNPFGNGPLNDYGRALSATAVSARWLSSKHETEENLANKSGFFYKKSKNKWLRPSLDYRGLLMKRNLGEENEDTEFIQMMADINTVIRYGNKLYGSFTFGYVPTPSSVEESGEDFDNYMWREAYLGYRFTPSFGVYIGLMDKIYGIRVAEHTNYARSVTNLTQNDQSHGIQLHYTHPKFEIGFGSFLGNYAQDEELRQVGNSLKADYVIAHKATIGASVLSSKSEFLQTYANALHFKTAVGKGSAFLAEVGQVSKKAIDGSIEENNDYAFGQAYLKSTRGVFIINSIEYLKQSDGSYRYRLGPGVQMFPAQRVELRVELYNTRNITKKNSTKDTWDFLGQVHLWF